MNHPVSPRQLELLLDFMEQHRSLALGRVRGKEGSALSKRLWQQLSQILNSEFNGAQKTANEWKKYFNQYKSRVKGKVRSIKQGVTGTGGGPAREIALTPLEERLFGILGGSNSPLPVRQNPLDSVTRNNDYAAAKEGEENADAGFSQPTEKPADPEAELPAANSQATTYTPEENEEIEMMAILSPDPPNADNSGEPTQAEPIVREETTHRKTTVNPRKRRRPALASSTVNNEFAEAGKHLAAMEQSRLEVDKALVCATNRQAAAFENLAEQIRQLVALYAQHVQQRQRERSTRKRRTSSSEADDE